MASSSVSLEKTPAKVDRRIGENHWTVRLKKSLEDALAENEKLKEKLQKYETDSSTLSIPVAQEGHDSGDHGGEDEGHQGGGGDSGDDSSDGGDDGGDDDPPEEPSIEGNKDYFNIYVDFRAVGINKTKSYWVKSSWKPKTLKALVLNSTKIFPSLQRFVRTNGGCIYETLTFAQNGIFTTVTLNLLMNLGGGGVRKVWLKREEALPALKDKATRGIIKTIVNDHIVMPEQFVSLMDYYTKVMEDLRLMNSQGTNIIAVSLRRISEADLRTIKDVMGYANRKGNTEEKLLRVLETLFPAVQTINEASCRLAKKKEEMQSEFISLYADNFNKYKSGEATFANEEFLRLIDQELGARERLRERDAPNANGQPDGGNNSNCGIM